MDGARGEDLFRDGAVTIAGLKTEFGISRSKAYEMMDSGQLPFTTPPATRRRLVPRLAVRRLLAQNLVLGAGEGTER